MLLLAGLRVGSHQNMLLKAGPQKSLTMQGGKVSLQAESTSRIQAEKIAVESGWAGGISLDANGGNVRIGQLELDGRGLTSHDKLGGVVWSSAEDVHVTTAPGRAMRLQGGKVQLEAAQKIVLEAPTIQLQSAFNQDIRFETHGGDVAVEALAFSGASVEARESTKPLRVTAPSGEWPECLAAN